jgi:hypothetical protein
VITCSRCGKENQDHYKFCLGCGNEIKAAPKAAAAREPAPLETARTILPPERTSQGQVPGNAAGNEPTPLPTTLGAAATPSVAKQKGGIPWNDSPKMPGAIQGAVATPAMQNGGASAAGTAAASASASGFMGGGPTPAPSGAPGGTTAGIDGKPSPSTAGPGASAAGVTAEGNVCPNCGRLVTPGFAFCGGCGTRMAPGGGAGAAATTGNGPQRSTVYMSQPSAAPVPRGRIILIRPDGSEGGAHPLHDGENLVGRGQGSLFEGDLYLSPRHAEFVLGPQGLVVKDLRSLNGIFVKIAGEEVLESGDVIRIGQELLRFEIIAPPAPLEDGTEVAGTPNPGFWGRLSVVVGREVDGSAFPLFGEAIVMGRERGDILFPEDGYVSGTHARISLRDGRVYLADVGSSNGTFLRVRGARSLASGGFVLMGQQLFRAEYR